MNEKWDILFLGRLFPKQKGDAIRKKATVDMQDAANVLQWNLINGMLENGVEHVHVVSYLPIDSWPKHYKDSFIKSDIEIYDDRCSFETVPFCNVAYVKQLLNTHACDSAVLRWAKKDNGAKKVIVCYTESNVLMRAVKKAKKYNSNIVSVQIIADITEFAANAQLNVVRRHFVEAQIKENITNRAYIDKFVLLTKQMKEKLGIVRPFIVMEGIVPNVELTQQFLQSKEKTIVYTGSMNKKYGILQLLDAFIRIPNENFKLLLCGLGNAESIINQYCERDKRIKFLGKVPHSEVIKLQQQATVLVNPRQNNEEFTKYSFPSKTMEYLASGVPVVAYKLDGIPEEYNEYIRYVADDSPETLAKVLQEICELSCDERREIGEKARKFVLSEKNRVAQTKRILDFIENIEI